jgi:hypothetical protein
MTDFLSQLEAELVDAARRRARTQSRSAWRARAGQVLEDLRALGSGAVLAGSVGAVAIVVAVVLAAGVGRSVRHVAAAGGAASPATQVRGGVATRTPCANAPEREVFDKTPGSGFADLLAGDRRATHAQAATALRDVNLPTGAEIYDRGVRVVRFPAGVRVFLLAAWICNPATDAPSRRSVVAEIDGRSATAAATLDLGTPAEIRSGRAFRNQDTTSQAWSQIVTIAGRRRSVAMVPAGVVRLLCHGAGPRGRTASFPVRSRVVLVSERATHHRCDLDS